MNKRVTVEARAYTNKEGMALLITSPRTDNTIVLFEAWFDHVAELMWLRTHTEMKIQRSPVIPVLIAFTSEDLYHYWDLYKRQQKDRGKQLPRGTR